MATATGSGTSCGAVMAPEFLGIYRRLGADYDLPIVLMHRFEGGNPRPPGRPAIPAPLVQAAEQAAAEGEQGGEDSDGNSRPIYVWNPSANTETFPSVPRDGNQGR